MRGAREHNLKDVTVAFPRDRLVVITGLSGSGKSSLAFDTIYAEGQRRYVESLSAYARQFLGQMEKPDVDQIDGLSPAISIDQKGASRNPRSTVGTVTEIYDHLRLLFARIGMPHCPNGHAIERQSVQQIVDQVLALPEGTRLLVLGPLIKDRKTEGDRIIDAARRQGFVRVRVDGETYDIGDAPKLEKYKRHSIEVVVDRYIVRHAEAPDGAERAADGRPIDPETGQVMPDPDASRLADSIETALRLGEGVVLIAPAPRDDEPPSFEERRYSEKYSCPYDGFTIDELEPRSLLVQLAARRLPDVHRSRDQARDRPGAARSPTRARVSGTARSVSAGSLSTDASWRMKILEAVCQAHGWDFSTPVRKLPKEALDYLLYAKRDQERVLVRYKHERGESTYKANVEGIITNLERRYRETDSDYIKTEIEKFMVAKPCPTCGGKRLRPEILAVTIGDRNIWDIATMSITDALRWADGLASDAQRARADDRLPGPQGDRGPARVPRRRRPRLPDARPDERDAVRWRGPAHPPRDPDRHDADGRPVHPRRAVDRAPPARQRQAHRHADAAARPGQHGPRRRARRGDHPDRRLGRRHRAGRRRARRRDHRERHARDAAGRASLDHRRVPPRRPGRARSRKRRRKGNGKSLGRARRPRAQPARRRPDGAARDVHVRHRRVAAAARARSSPTCSTAPWPAS